MLAHTVHLADAACMMLGVGLGVDGLAYTVDPTTPEALGFDNERLMVLMDELEPPLADAEAA